MAKSASSSNARFGKVTPARGTLVASDLPGRMRLRDPGLRHASRCEALAVQLRVLPGVLSAETNAAAGSVLIRYDSTRGAADDIAAAASAWLGAHQPRPQAPRKAQPASRTGATWKAAREWNRFAKLGMLASFPVSLALAAAGAKKLHAATGGVFSLLLLVHLYVHQRHLTK